MNITKYEIDFINVKDADAILIHFWDDDRGADYVVSIDAGRYNDGDEVSRFVKEYYKKDTIDVAVVTHCDEDHYGGYVKILENRLVKINEFWLNDPGKYVTVDKYKYFRKLSSLRAEVRNVYNEEGDKNLLDLIPSTSIRTALSYGGDFYSAFDGIIEILAPTKQYYESLVPDLRHNAKPYDTNIEENDNYILEAGDCISKSLDNAPDDTSTHNASSVIIMFKPDDDHKFIFMGDACRVSVDKMIVTDCEKMRNATLLKLPHHGSVHNMDSDMINLINPFFAIASAESASKYFSPVLRNALKRKGTKVYSTYTNGSLLYSEGLPTRNGYSTSTPM